MTFEFLNTYEFPLPLDENNPKGEVGECLGFNWDDEIFPNTLTVPAIQIPLDNN